MAFQLQRPILIGGLGLTATLWLLEALHPHTASLGGSVVWMAIALGSGLWWLRQQTRSPLDLGATITAPVDRTSVETALEQVNTQITYLETELVGSKPDLLDDLRKHLTQLTEEMDRSQLRLSVMGGKSVGKTTLTQQVASLLGAPQSTSSASAPDTSVGLGATDVAQINTSDLVLFVTTGDLTDSEFQAVDQILQRQQRLLLVFNKADQYLPDERSLVLQHLRDRLSNRLATEDIVAIAAQPVPVKVRQHQPDGSIQESLEQPSADLAGLSTRLQSILAQEGQRLVLATVQRQAIALKLEVLKHLNQIRRDRAMPLIEQSQWIAAATAFANPVPSLDLLATAAISTQLIVDLGAVYKQSFSLDQAKTIATTLAEQLVKLGLVELSSQAIAPLLKSHALTYVAGGLVQGVSAAYLTRVSGLCLVTYFEEQTLLTQTSSGFTFQLDRLLQKLKAVFQDNQRTAFLQTLVKQSIQRLAPNAA